MRALAVRVMAGMAVMVTAVLTVLLTLLVPVAAVAQISFERTYGDTLWEEGASVAQTADGGYIISGYTDSFGAGGGDVYLIRTDMWGDTVWTRTYGGADDEYGHSVEERPDGGFMIAGDTRSFGAGGSDVYLIRTNAMGDTIATRTYGGTENDLARSLRRTAGGGYVIAGFTASFGAGATDVYLIKTGVGGDTIWTRTYGGEPSDGAYVVKQTPDGGYFLAGNTYSYGAGGSDVYLIKTDDLGDTMWTRTYGGTSNESAYSAARTADGGYILAGYTTSYGAGQGDVYLIKTDDVGDTAWTRTYGGAEWDGGSSVKQTDDGGYIIAGVTASFGAGGYDLWLLKTDDVGDTVWTRTYGEGYDDEGLSVQQTADGGYVVAGYTGGGLDQIYADLYLVKTDADGLVGVNHAPDLFDQPDTTVAEEEYLTFTLEAIDPELDTIWFSSPLLPAGATLDSAGGVFEWTPDDQQAGVYVVTFIATDVGEPALADTEETQITVTEVGVSGDEDGLPVRAQYLAQNRPNPFGSSTAISYSVRERQPVSLRIYDIRGALVRELLGGTVGAGVHRVSWDGRDGRGREVGSGVYFCHLVARDWAETRRMVLLR